MEENIAPDYQRFNVKRTRTTRANRTRRPRMMYGIDVNNLEWMEKIPECPVFQPSRKDFEDPLAFLRKIASQVSTYGICKIVSPLDSFTPAGIVINKELKNFRFEPILQPLMFSAWRTSDEKISYFNIERNCKYKEFEEAANAVFANKYSSAACLPPRFIEREFWHEMASGTDFSVEYGVNIDGSAFSSDPEDELGNSNWNLKTFPRQPKSTLRLLNKAIPGITDPMFYIGMLFSTFAWHVEDHYLYSINYHHSGAPKTWYGVPGCEARNFEKVAYDHVYHEDILPSYDQDGAAELLSEKTTMLPPSLFLKHNIPVYKAVQMPGDFVITFPRAYHAGFSHGFNCAEAVNFAVGDWFPYGLIASKRYSLLDRPPIIPFEELLCKEAVLLSQNMGSEDFKPSSDELISQQSIMASCIHLVEDYRMAREKLSERGVFFNILPNARGSVYCGYCKKDRYLSYITCHKCRAYPRCLSHEISSTNCSSCGKELIVHISDDMPAVEAAAAHFEQEKNFLSSYFRDTAELQREIQELHTYGGDGGEASTSSTKPEE